MGWVWIGGISRSPTSKLSVREFFMVIGCGGFAYNIIRSAANAHKISILEV